LNTTARKNIKMTDKLNPYLINATYCVVTAKIAHPIQAFNEEQELAMVKQDDDR
jgi:hypothetical protein